MSANLDKSLDDLVGNRRQTARRRTNRRAAPAKPSVGGVKKSARGPKPGAKAVHPTPAAPTASSKIIVSGLPADVTEANIKEYFTKSAGPVKKVMLTYNQNGTSRGIASIIFAKADTAAKAAKELNGLLVDGRAIKVRKLFSLSMYHIRFIDNPEQIELVYDASYVPAVPVSKPLNERIAPQKPKSKPKPATANKAANTNTAGNARGNTSRRGRNTGRNAGRGKPKSVEELDAEMVDYFAGGENAPADNSAPVNGAAPQANGGEDLGMAEIS
ncbi:mRNA export protein mlo3 [Penicillium verhagenii]|uniref:mRNA export protein mlo3 n=1 Tax=Penicillium verhagenii TaxID=1562060 RepID=UPI0025450F26|nr:mRNA export protein mlo3 [Penicillium verhagenii]KAJ5939007.1 mRNA export protein mlo3 [Penicillium verhagenii]